MVKNLPAMSETWVWSLGQEDPWRREWYPLQYSCLENLMDKGAWQVIVHRVQRIGHEQLTHIVYYYNFYIESEVAQLCLTLVTQGLQPTRVHGIFQVRVLEWGAISFCVRGQNSYLDFWDRRLYIKWCRKSAQFRYGVQSCRSHGPLQNQEDVIFQGIVLLMLRECFSLQLSRSFCGLEEVWSTSNVDTQSTVQGREKNRLKFFLSCHKTWILTQGLELLLEFLHQIN